MHGGPLLLCPTGGRINRSRGLTRNGQLLDAGRELAIVEVRNVVLDEVHLLGRGRLANGPEQTHLLLVVLLLLLPLLLQLQRPTASARQVLRLVALVGREVWIAKGAALAGELTLVA